MKPSVRRLGLFSLATLCTFVLVSMPTWAEGSVLGPALSTVEGAAEGGGVIQGQIINGTPGGGSVAGLEVILRVFRDRDEGEQRSTTTDGQGQFRFADLETASDWTYLLSVTYEGVVYSQGMLAFEAGQSELVVEIKVYETTTEGKDVVVERAHVFATVGGTTLSVTELYVFANPTDRTYIGTEEIEGRRWTSRFLLPVGSRNLTFDDGALGGRFLSTQGGFVDTEPHWPGTTSVLFSYDVECPGGDCNLAREVTHPISNLNVLIPDAGANVEGAQLAFQGRQQAQGNSYLNYVARSLMPGQKLDLRVRLPGSVSGSALPQRGGTQALPWIILGTVIVALILIYPFWRRRLEAAARKKAR